jgi:putative hydrolase of the HAD superfamily
MIAAALFDLDDTLFPQASWLAGAWRAVAARAASFGVPEQPFLVALEGIAAQGTARGRIIDRALAARGHADVPVAPLVRAFRSHAPEHLECYPEVREQLALLSARVPVAIVTDGDPRIQRQKLQSLALTPDVVVCSDALGRAYRKPHALPYLRALALLGVSATAAVFVGDRPATDLAGAQAVGMRTIRVRTGEYAHEPDGVADQVVDSAADAIRLLLGAAYPSAASRSATSANPAS